MIQTLNDLIAQVESGNNPWAMRFEPAFTPSTGAIAIARKMMLASDATLRTICATSWGKYQIMGENLYSAHSSSHGVLTAIKLWPGEFMASVGVQDSFFSMLLTIWGINFPLADVVSEQSDVARLAFARRYNGPGNPQAYADRIMQVWAANK